MEIISLLCYRIGQEGINSIHFEILLGTLSIPFFAWARKLK